MSVAIPFIGSINSFDVSLKHLNFAQQPGWFPSFVVLGSRSRFDEA